MEAQFTPGPWSPSRTREMEITGRIIPIVSGEQFPTAFTPAWDRPAPGEVDGGGEALANARLIAAAPDLYEALKSIDDFWTTEHRPGPDGDPHVWGGAATLTEETRDVWRKIRAALAKAASPSDQKEG